MPHTDERIDLYIDQSAEFARPILTHLRKLVHTSCPKVEETIKWGMPIFEYSGGTLCYMTSFKQHCVFGFGKGKELSDPHKTLTIVGKTAMATFGKINQQEDLPGDKIIKEYIKEAMTINDESATAKKSPSKKSVSK